MWKRHARKRSYTWKYDQIPGSVLRPYSSVSCTEENDRLRSIICSCTIFWYEGRLCFPNTAVYPRLRSYQRVNTRWNTTVILSQVFQQYMVVNGAYWVCVRSYTIVYSVRNRRPGYTSNAHAVYTADTTQMRSSPHRNERIQLKQFQIRPCRHYRTKTAG